MNGGMKDGHVGCWGSFVVGRVGGGSRSVYLS